MTPDIVSVVIRACSFLTLLQAAGAMLFLAVFGRQLVVSRPSIQRLCMGSVIAAVVFISLHYGLEAARLAGEWGGVLDRELQGLVWQSSASTAWILRLIALLLIATGAHGTRIERVLVGVAGSTLAIVSFTLVGHTSAAASKVLPAALAVHLAAVAFWFGSLLPLASMVRHELPQLAARSVASFSRLAGWLVAVLFAAGAFLLFRLLPEWSVLMMPYGRLALAKVAAFGILMGLAAVNRWRYVPLLVQQDAARQALRHTVWAEYVLISVVLLLTAVMTTFYSPEL
jgi:putative copper export protein